MSCDVFSKSVYLFMFFLFILINEYLCVYRVCVFLPGHRPPEERVDFCNISVAAAEEGPRLDRGLAVKTGSYSGVRRQYAGDK